MVGSSVEDAAVGNIGDLDKAMTGRNDDLNRRPPIVHCCREFKAIHCAGHVDICKNEANRWLRLQDGDCLVGICGLEDPKRLVLELPNNVNRMRISSSTTKTEIESDMNAPVT